MPNPDLNIIEGMSFGITSTSNIESILPSPTFNRVSLPGDQGLIPSFILRTFFNFFSEFSIILNLNLI